jgi:transposase
MLDDEISFESSGGGEPPVRRMEVLSGPGGRRRWTAEAKGRIIEETCVRVPTTSQKSRVATG